MPAPGTLTFTEGIKTALVDDHHEAFYWWWKSKLEGATLFHVDGHDDMAQAYVERRIETAEDYKLLDIGNFICPAVHHNLVSSVYWLNPHAKKERKLHYFEKRETSFSGGHELYKDHSFKYAWSTKVTKKIKAKEIEISSDTPLILDIDLDAFCCHQKDTLSFLPVKSEEYEGALDYEQRVEQTMKILSRLPRPDFITIASSQGNGKDDCYVPPFMVDDVSRYLAINLRKLYG